MPGVLTISELGNCYTTAIYYIIMKTNTVNNEHLTFHRINESLMHDNLKIIPV